MVSRFSRVGPGLFACTLILAIGLILARSRRELEAAPLDRKEPKITQLQKERLKVLRALADLTAKDYKAGKVSAGKAYEANLLALQAEVELCERHQERLALLEKAVKLARDYDDEMAKLSRAGQVPRTEAVKAQVDRLNAEIALERLRWQGTGGG